MLVEKAIANEYESYDGLEGGAIDYALMLITGNPAFRYNLCNYDTQMLIADNSLWKKLVKYSENCFLLGAGTLPRPEMPLANQGLEEAHAYAILETLEFDENRLLKLKNPWGISYWLGNWSNGSSKWTSRALKFEAMRKQEMKELREKRQKLVGNNQLMAPLADSHQRSSSLYISWEDFTKAFEVIFVSISFDESWERKTILDKWEAGRAGGSTLFLQTVQQNPQYLLRVAKRTEVFCLLTQLIPPASKGKLSI